MSANTSAHYKRWRGVVLELVDGGHKQQASRMDYLTLWGLMQDLGHDVSRNDVITICQDLGDRGYLTFETKKNNWTGATELYEIQILPAGRDLIERTKFDVAVHLL